MKRLFEKLGSYWSGGARKSTPPSTLDAPGIVIPAVGLSGIIDPDFEFREAVILTDHEGKIYECNKNVEAILGLGRDEILGRLTSSFTPEPENWAARRSEIIETLGRGEDWRGEVLLFHWDGLAKPVRVHMSAIREPDGAISGTISAFVDIGAEGASIKALQRNTEIFSQIREGIILNALDGTILDCNEEAARQLGYTREDMIGTAPGMFAADPEAYVKRREEVIALLRNNKGWDDVISFRHKDGSVRMLDMRISPLIDSLGAYQGAVSLLIDVTAQYAAEEERERSEAMLNNAQRIAHVGSWEWDIVADERAWSDEMCRIYGLEPQPMGTSYEVFLDAIHVSDQSVVDGGLRALLENDVPYHVIYRIARPDGAFRYVEEQAEVSRDENGAPIRISGTVQDITARRTAELALEESQRQLDDAQSIANIGHFNIPMGTERAEWSSALKRMFQISEDDLAPTSEEFKKMVHPDDLADVIKNHEELLAGEAPDSNSFRAIIGGGIRHIQVRQKVDRNADGEVLAIFGTFQDVTDAKESDIALEENRALLERAQSIAHIGHWEFWADMSRPADWSNECRRILGLGADDRTPDLEGFLALVHESDRDRVSHFMESLMAGEELSALGFLAVVNGDIRYIECRNFLNRDETGAVRSIFGTLQDVTDRRVVELELEKKEELLEEAYALAKMGHWEFDLVENRGFWSDTVWELLGQTKGEIKPMGSAVYRHLHPDDREWYIEYEKNVSGKGVLPVLDVRIVVEGETRHIRMHSHEVRDADGELLRTYGTVQDITQLKVAESKARQMNASLEMRVKMRTAELTAEVSERTKAEEQLRVQKEFSEQLINAADVGIVVLDNDGKIQRMNRYLEDVTGYEIDEVRGEDWFETMLPDFERSRVRGVFGGAIDGVGQPGTINAVRAKSGKLHYMEWSDAPLTGVDGEIIGLLAIGQDVTQRLRDQAQIFELSRRNEQILEAAGEGIYGIDLDGNCTFINNAGCQMLGLTRDDIIGRNAHDAVHHSHADGSHYEVSNSPIYAAANEGIVQTISDEVFWRADGNKFPVEYTSTPIIEDGRITGAVVVFHDISDAQLLQQQVIQTSKLATLGEMATGVAHEINQPLNIIRMAASNVRRKVEKGDIDAAYIVEKLQRIDAQTGRAAEIIDHMRIFGRKSETIPVPINPVETTEAALAMLSQQIKLADIEMDIDLAADCGMVMGHKVQLEQVMLNLLGNARHQLQSDDGEEVLQPRIRLSVQPVPAADPVAVEIIVADNAGGIPDDVLPRIFEPFFTTKEIGEGTGLGLSISYGIIGDMGGTIAAHNEGLGVDRGAVFTISLPLAKVKAH